MESAGDALLSIGVRDHGERFGRYQLGTYLGRGGMGEVYLARADGPSGFEKRVAIKILSESHARDVERSRRLVWEALVSCRLDHANIVSVLDAGETDGRPFMVMEYVRGHSLAQLLGYLREAGELLPLSSAVFIARKVAAALDYVHNLPAEDGGPGGLIHGDTSPSNVLLAADGRVKLADFGVASAAASAQPGGVGVAGKLSYLPLAAFEGRPARPEWDVYALACMLYEMVTGAAPFAGERFGQVRLSLTRGCAPVNERRPDCPPALAEVIERAISRDEELHFTTARALLAGLDAAWPRTVDDADLHRAYVEARFAADAFVDRFGPLPAPAGITARFATVPPSELEMVPTTPSAVGPPLRLGLSPALGAELARAHGEALAHYLSAHLGRTVLTTVFADYRTLADSLISGEVDVGWMPPLAMISVLRRGGGALASSQRRGASSYRAAIVVRADAPYQALTDLDGRNMAWVDRQSASGYRVALAMLTDAFGGRAPTLGREHFHGSHRAVCEAVANGWADAGATYASTDADGNVSSSGWLDVMGDRAAELRVLALSPPIPSDGIAHRPGLPGDLYEALRALLGSMAADDRGRALLADVFNAEALALPSGDLLPDSHLAESLERVDAGG